MSYTLIDNDTGKDIIETITNQKEEIERLKEDNEYLNKVNIELSTEKNRLNNIIERLEEDLREMYLTFGEFSEEYTEKKIKELKENKQ